MKRAVIVMCIVATIGIMVALIWLISEWIWSWNIPEWMKVRFISK